MYRLIFADGQITNCYSLLSWQRAVSALQAEGVNYKRFKRTNFGYAFYY